MTRPTARVLALLEILQSGGTRTARELSVQLGVDSRTVRRYLAHLMDLEIPVESVRGRYGGYRLAPGYRLPPLMLTDDEALAVLMGIAVGGRAGLLPTSASAAEGAAAKLHRVLPNPLARRLQALLQTAEFSDGTTPATTVRSGVLLRVAQATSERRPLSLDYTTPDGRRSTRTVHPYGVVAHSGRWYLTGADSTSGATRTFRLDRVTAADLLPGGYDLPDGFDATEHVLSGLAQVPYRHAVALRVKGTPDQVRSRLPAGLAVVDDSAAGPADEGWVSVHLRAERLDWVPGVLAGLGLPFVVERPDALRALVAALGRDLLAAADPAGTV